MLVVHLIACAVPDAPEVGSDPDLTAEDTAGAPEQPGPTPEEAGEVLYDQHCAGCHGASGAGTYAGPPLAVASMSDEELLDQVLEGSGRMPGFAEKLSDDDLADLIAFLRAAFP